MIKKPILLYIIIAFLSGMIVMDLAQGLKIPDIILPESIDPDLREELDYITNILNNGRYVVTVHGAAISSSSVLSEGEFGMDDSGVTKYLVVSNGVNNYRVEVTQIP